MTLTISVIENKRLLYWDQVSSEILEEQIALHYDPDRDELQENKQRDRVTGYTVWRNRKTMK